MPVPDWIQELLHELCELYKLIGGECAGLSQDPRERIDEVQAAYDPVNPPSSDWAAINRLLDALEALRVDANNPLSQGDDTALDNLIKSIRPKVTP